MPLCAPSPKPGETPPDEKKKKAKEKEKWGFYLTRLLHVISGPCVKHHSITHVANGTYNDIWVLCDGDRKYINRMNGSFQSAIVRAEFNMDSSVYYEANSVGFTKIKSGEALAFELHHNGIIYVTIRESVGNGYRTVCDCFPIRHDQSVIVGVGGYIYRTNYGNVWLEEGSMRNHYPTLDKQPSIEESSGLSGREGGKKEDEVVVDV